VEEKKRGWKKVREKAGRIYHIWLADSSVSPTPAFLVF
jgi:hypothetical protein